MAMLTRNGAELGKLDDFETWMEMHQGRFSRRCMFIIPRALSPMDPRAEGLGVKLDDGTTWELFVKRAESDRELRIHVMSAILEPAVSSTKSTAAA